jgi:hypothetical protein
MELKNCIKKLISLVFAASLATATLPSLRAAGVGEPTVTVYNTTYDRIILNIEGYSPPNAFAKQSARLIASYGGAAIVSVENSSAVDLPLKDVATEGYDGYCELLATSGVGETIHIRPYIKLRKPRPNEPLTIIVTVEETYPPGAGDRTGPLRGEHRVELNLSPG